MAHCNHLLEGQDGECVMWRGVALMRSSGRGRSDRNPVAGHYHLLERQDTVHVNQQFPVFYQLGSAYAREEICSLAYWL